MIEKTLLMLAACLTCVCGCANPDLDGFNFPKPPSAKVQVDPAQGGGGDITPATIPIVVRVQVEQQQAPQQVVCDCGCKLPNCECPERPQQKANLTTVPELPQSPVSGGVSNTEPAGPFVQTIPEPEPGGLETWHVSGTLHWRDSAGTEWYLTQGGTLSEGGHSIAGNGRRFEMKNGRMTEPGVSSVRSSGQPLKKVQYVRQCNNGFCRLVPVE